NNTYATRSAAASGQNIAGARSGGAAAICSGGTAAVWSEGTGAVCSGGAAALDPAGALAAGGAALTAGAGARAAGRGAPAAVPRSMRATRAPRCPAAADAYAPPSGVTPETPPRTRPRPRAARRDQSAVARPHGKERRVTRRRQQGWELFGGA